MNDTQKAFVTCFFVLLLSIGMVKAWQGKNIQFIGSDFAMHYYAAGGTFSLDLTTGDPLENRNISPEAIQSYPPFWRWVSSPFAYNETTYITFILFVFGFLMPMTYFFFLKNWVVTLFYFSTNLFFYVMQTGAYPSFLAAFLACYVMFLDDRRLKLVVLLVSLFIHEYGFVLVAIAWLITEIVPLTRKFSGLPAIACFSIGSRVLNPIVSAKSISQGVAGKGPSVVHLVHFFVKFFNPVLGVLVVRGLKSKKELLGLFVMAFLLFVGSFVISRRLLFMVPVFLLPLSVHGYVSLSARWRRFVLFGVVLFFGWNLFTWSGDLYLRLTGLCP